jgi:hypothetical protein
MHVLLGFLLWCLLLVLCWPLALLAMLLLPFVWLVALPFRVAFAAVEGLLAIIRGLFLLPGRVLGGLRRP